MYRRKERENKDLKEFSGNSGIRWIKSSEKKWAVMTHNQKFSAFHSEEDNNELKYVAVVSYW